MNTLVSVVIPAKNRANQVVRAVESVLAQDYPHFEIILVDDGSTDDLDSQVRDKFPEIKFIRNQVSLGGAGARNVGARAASGEYIAFLDSDDEMKPDHLSSKIQFMLENDAQGVFGSFFLREKEIEEEIQFSGDSFNQIGDKILGNERFDARTSTFVFHKEYFDQVRFDDDLMKHQDWDLAIRFSDKYNFKLHTYPSTVINVEHGERMSSNVNYDGSKYFLQKNASYLKGNSILVFCVKQWWKAKSRNTKEADRFLLLADKYKQKMSLSDRVLLGLLKTGVVNPSLLYKLKKLVYR